MIEAPDRGPPSEKTNGVIGPPRYGRTRVITVRSSTKTSRTERST